MEGTIGEIRLFAGNFAPYSWAFCQGQLLAISSNTAFFSILGTTYGGDGRVTFGLPDFRGRMPIGAGQGQSLSPYDLGETTGAAGFTMTAGNLPAHTHNIVGTVTMSGTSSDGNADSPQNNYPAAFSGTEMYSNTSDGSFMGNMQQNLAIGSTGASLPVTNVQPMLGLNFIICMQGIFPSRP